MAIHESGEGRRSTYIHAVLHQAIAKAARERDLMLEKRSNKRMGRNHWDYCIFCSADYWVKENGPSWCPACSARKEAHSPNTLMCQCGACKLTRANRWGDDADQ